MSVTETLLQRGNQVLIGNYARQPVVMVRGSGCWVWDSNERKYLDLFAGFGGGILGHCHPELTEVAIRQAQQLWHVGNTFHTEPQIELAERLNRFAFPGQAFFCHSGAEANEAACKLARLRGKDRSPRRWKIISLQRSFHGRTLAMISATGNPKVKEGFEPLVPGFTQVEAGDFSALEKAVDGETAGVLMEPIQGEGGVNVYPDSYAHAVRELCDHHGLTLIFDEVWTGCGRTGKWFAYQHFTDGKGGGVLPDILTLGKAVGGGLPLGVMFARPDVAKLLVPGTHGSTLGGNAICSAVSRTIFDIIEREKLVEHAAALGEWAMKKLRNEPRIASRIKAIRGRGLMLGIELVNPPEMLVDKGLERGVVVNLTAQRVIRLAPPINITREEWEQGIGVVVDLIASL